MGAFDDLIPGSEPASGGMFDDLVPAKKQNKGIASDLVTDAKRGIEQLPGILTGLADIPIAGVTGTAYADKATNAIGDITGFKPAQWSKNAEAEYSPGRQAAKANVNQAWEQNQSPFADAAKGDFTGIGNIAKSYIQNPQQLVGSVVESLPSMVAGGVAGKALAGAAKIAPVLAGAAGEGAVMAGQQMDQLSDTDADPRAAAAASLLTGIGGAAVGAMGGKVAQRMGVIDPDTALAGGAARSIANETGDKTIKGTIKDGAKRIAGGAVSEGMFEELPQSVLEQVLSNLAQGKPWEDGVSRAAVEGTLAGGLMGGAFNVLPGKPAEKAGAPTPEEEQQIIAGLLPAPTYTGTPGGQIVQSDAERQAAIDKAQAESDALWAERDAYAQQQADYSKQPIPTIITDPEPIQRRIDALMGINESRLKGAARSNYEKALENAFGEQVGYVVGKDGLEIPFTMADYLNSQVKSADITRDKPKAERANQQSAERLDLLISEEATQQPDIPSISSGINPAPAIPVIGTLSKVANMAVQSGAHAATQQAGILAGLANQGANNGPIATQAASQVATPSAQVAGGDVPESASVPSSAPAGNATGTSNGAPVAAPGVRPAVSAGATSEQAPAVATQPAGEFDVSGREDFQLKHLASTGKPGWKEAAIAELQRRGIEQSANSETVPAQNAANSEERPNGDGVTDQQSPSDQAKAENKAKLDAAIAKRKADKAAAVDAVSKPKSTTQQSTIKQDRTGLAARDDLVGAIMRVTGNNGISAGMAQTITGDKAGSGNAKLRGLFTNKGTMDLGDVAELLRVQENFDVRDGDHLSELIRNAAAGDVATSMVRTEEDAAAAEDAKRKDYYLKRASELGLKGIGGKRKLEHVIDQVDAKEAEIAAKEKEISELEAKEERAAIQASNIADSIYQEGSELTEADLMQWLGQQIEYSQDEINEANTRSSENESRRAEAYAIDNSEGQAQGSGSEGNGAGQAEGRARGTVARGERLNAESNLPSNTVIVDGEGKPYRVHYHRNHLVIAHPIINGVPEVNADTTVRFWVTPNRIPSSDSDRTDPIYRATEELTLTGQTNAQAAEQFAQQNAPETDQVGKAQADRERDAVPFSMQMQSQPKPQGRQTGLFTADGRVSVEAKPDTVDSASQPKTDAAPEANQDQAPAITEQAAGNKAEIEDFGEKLGGAKKDRMPSMSATLSDDDIATQPLSKIWPASEIDSIEEPFVAAVAHSARAEVPAKPRVAHKVARWVEKVKVVRNLAQRILDGSISKDRFAAVMKTISGLDGFAAKVALLESIDRKHWGRIGNVREYPGAYRYGENGEKIASPSVVIDLDGKFKRFEGAKSVADIIEQMPDALGDGAQEKKMQFEVRGKKGSFSINKKGDKEYRSLKTFADSKEAFSFIKDNYADLVAAWDGVKEIDNVTKADIRNADNRPRTGKDRRNGKDVSDKQFEDAFGFRGVEFGKWVKQGANAKERQGMLNQAFDAMHDLAEIVGIPPKAISLNGTLGLGFGSRGSGSASAHFEPGNLVINLTKTKGAGTLAHEWFHALDNYFARMRNDGNQKTMAEVGNSQDEYRRQNFVTYKPEPLYVHKTKRSTAITRAELERYHAGAPSSAYYDPASWHKDPKHPDGVRAEVETAFAELVNALNDSPMARRARLIDKAANGYWSRIIERGARSFENYIISKMMEGGYNNDYLANVREVKDFPRSKERYPYLLPDEVAPIAEAFDTLFSRIQTKETDKGVALYNKADDPFSPDRYDAKLFADSVGKIIETGNVPRNDLTVGDTPEVFKALGAKARSMVMPASVVKKATDPTLRGHDVSVEDLKNLPSLLADPVMVFDSQTETGALVAMVEATDKSGNPVIVAVHVDTKGSGFHSVNKVASVYGKEGTAEIQRWINGSLRYYNKQKAPGWLRAVGLQLPEANTIKRLNKSVVTDGDIVKASATGNGSISAADKAIYGMAAEGKSAADILKFIASASRNPFNRQLAKLLMKTGIAPRITVGDSKGWKFNAGEGNKYTAAYNPTTDMVALFRPAAAERNALHEFVHAASIKALSGKGMAATQMKALYQHVKKTGKLKGMYGMSDIDEFIAEAFTNPKFQAMLKTVPARSESSGVKSAWHWFVRIVKGILKLPSDRESALSQALEIGVGVMRENMKAGDESSAYTERMEKDNLDPGDEDAMRVQSAIEGKSVVGVAQWISVTGSMHEQMIARKVLARLKMLESAGVNLKLTVAHVGDSIPRTLLGARGITTYKFGKQDPSVAVWINGADVTGKVGTSTKTVLHELVHAATMGAIRLGGLKVAAGTKLAADVSDLYAVSNAVIRHFNQRVSDSQAGKVSLTDFEQQMFNRENNAFADAHEAIAWALSDPNAQAYLEGIPYKSKSAWTAFVGSIRSFLGLAKSADTALSEILRVSEAIMSDNINDMISMANITGTAMATQTASDQMVVSSKAEEPTIRYNVADEGWIVGDSGREYDQAQRDFFKNVGRDVSKKGLIERSKEYLQNDFWKKMAVGIVDQFRGLRDLNDNGQAYMLARLSKGTAGAFETLLHHGKLSIKDGVYDGDQSGGFIEKLGTPLQGELDDFLWYVAANRAEGLAKNERENLFTADDIAAGKSLARGETKFDYTIQTGPGKGKVTRNRAVIFADANRVFNEFQKNTLDIAEQSGLIDGASRKFWESEFYVPFYRVSEEDGEFIGAKMGQSLVRQQAFKKLKGGTDKLNSDLLSNTLLNWSHLIEASAKNRAAKAALTAAEASGAAHKASYGDKKTVWYMGEVTRNLPKGTAYTESGVNKVSDGTAQITTIGKIEYVVDDPFVMTAITSLEYAGMRNGIMDVMTKFKHWLTIGVTASPAFKVRNLIRDSVQAIGTSDLGYNPIKNVVDGFKQTKRDKQEYVSALASGGLIRFGTMLEGSESARVRQLVKSGVKDSTILNNEPKWRQFYDKYLEPGISAYNELGNRSEEISRAALYNQLIKQGKSHAEAALLARDLMDFSMQGSFNTIRFLTQIVPFMNARLQGMYKLGRSAKDNPRKLAIVTGAVAMASIALMLGYDDDDDWKRREDWDRDNFWWFKFADVEFRIPKPFEVGAVGTLAERSLEYMINDEMTGERFKSVVGSLVMNNLSMNPVPQMLKPIVDLYANKDSFTKRPIESMGMQRLDPTMRFNSSTSMVGRGLSSATGGALSPVQYDHLARAYFGWLGSFVVGGADMGYRMVSDEPTQPTRDYFKFATQGILKEQGTGNSRYLSQMYEQAKELEQAHATYRQLLKDGKIEDAQEYAEDNKESLSRYRQVESVKRMASKFNERIRAIERSDIDADQKKEQINNIKKMKEIAAKRLSESYSPL